MLYNIFPNKTPNFPCIFKINFVPLRAYTEETCLTKHYN